MIERWVEEKLQKKLNFQRIVCVVGPRQCGKTTLVKALAAKSDKMQYVTLDDSRVLTEARQSPSFFLRENKANVDCFIIDEVQKAPGLISELKIIVDEDDRPGQFLITGSADYRKLPHATESLAGRVGFVPMRFFGEAEIRGVAPVFLERLFDGILPRVSMPEATLAQMLEVFVRGGIPFMQNAHLSKEERAEWFNDYLENQIVLDVQKQWEVRRTAMLRELLKYCAIYSSKLLNVRGISTQLSANYQTLQKYFDVLESMYLVDRVPAWAFNPYELPGKTPKLVMNDSALMSHLLGIECVDDLMRDSQRRADHLGKLAETWVYNQLMAEVQLHPLWNLYHLRIANHEIDFMIRNEKGDVLGIEVKAAETVTDDDFKHLRWFAEKNKDVKFTGIVLYTGNLLSQRAENLYAVPMTGFWAPRD